MDGGLKVMERRVSAIVPAYNEERTIGEVVRVLRSSPLIAEVIVVSDGSRDGTARAARAAGADVLELATNLGKAGALLEGVKRAQGEVLLFADADLIGFTQKHIEDLLLPVQSGQWAMNVGLRDRGEWLRPLLSLLPFIGGERALRRVVIEGVPSHYLKGFMVESALNYYCRANRLPYGSVFLSGLRIRRKYEKVGWKLGLWQYLRMSAQVVYAMLVVRLAHVRGRFAK